MIGLLSKSLSICEFCVCVDKPTHCVHLWKNIFHSSGGVTVCTKTTGKSSKHAFEGVKISGRKKY